MNGPLHKQVTTIERAERHKTKCLLGWRTFSRMYCKKNKFRKWSTLAPFEVNVPHLHTNIFILKCKSIVSFCKNHTDDPNGNVNVETLKPKKNRGIFEAMI